VTKPKKQIMQSANTVQIDSHAAATLRYIRASMEAAVSFAIPGSAELPWVPSVYSPPRSPPFQPARALARHLVGRRRGGERPGGSLLARPESLQG